MSPPSSSGSVPVQTRMTEQIPKQEIDVLDLWQQDPKADGRGVRIAVLDTGCDLAAQNMQRTTTGLPKYLDFIDATGDGDIDTKTRVTLNLTASNDGDDVLTVVGLSGKTLTLPRRNNIFSSSTTANETCTLTLRLGVLRLFHILPKTVLKRVQQERKAKFFQTHYARLAKAQQALDQLQYDLSVDHQTPKQTKQTKQAQQEPDDNNTNSTTNTSTLQKQIKEQKLLIDQLQDMVQDYDELCTAGPLMDVVLFQTPYDDDVLSATTTTTTTTNTWRALIDVHADGNLTNATVLAPYAVQHQFGTLGFGSQVTFCIQVYENGDILSLVCDAGSHGTHVAAICAANYCYDDDNDDDDDDGTHHQLSQNLQQKTNTTNPGNHNTTTNTYSTSTSTSTEKNGVAPGAQVLAIKIGDNRVASAETGTGIIRALAAAKKYNCRLINLSFGEPSWQPDSGRVSQIFEDAVHKWGMTVFTSAGNDGPALSSLGSPGSLSSVVTVGAYVSPQMMVDQYSTLMESHSKDNENNNKDDENINSDDSQLPGASYSFSSRGPTPDGVMPDLCAPGGAIAPIPRHTLQGKGQKHGTSMASPSACGLAAVVLSALEAHGLDNRQVNTHELRRALQNSAKSLPQDNVVVDPFAQGAGLVSATRAVQYILAHHGKPGQNMAFDVKVPTKNNARGIYIRDSLQLAGPMTMTVSVRPRIDHSLYKTDKEMEDMLSLELEFDLVPSSPGWLQCPKRLTLLSTKERATGQTFSIRIDPRKLPSGPNYATVDAIDLNDPDRGPLFQVPVTVIVPHAILREPKFAFAMDGKDVAPTAKILDADSDKSMTVATNDNGVDFSMAIELTPGAPKRRFLSVPHAAEWASIKIRSTTPTASRSGPHSLILHAIPFVRGDLHNKMIQLKKFFQLDEGIEREFQLNVRPGSTLEVCLQLSWLANPTKTSVIADVEFHSLDARPPTLVSNQPVRISASTEFARIGASAPLRSEKINPKATLSRVYRTIRPKEYKISAASFDDRDVLPPSDAELKACKAGDTSEENSKHGTLVLKSYIEYNFELAESKDDTSISITPRIPSLFRQLYDSPVDSQLWILQDANGKVLGYGGCIHDASPITLTTKVTANYKLFLRIAHPSRKVLEELKDLPLRLSMKLSKALDCPIYTEMNRASVPGVSGDDGSSPIKEKTLRRGDHCDLYISRPTWKIPDWIQPGDVMVGNIQLNQKGSGTTTLDLVYELPPKSCVKDGSQPNNDDDTENKQSDNSEDGNSGDEEALAEAIFHAKVKHLSKLRSRKNTAAYKELADALKSEKSDSLTLLEECVLFAKEVRIDDDDDDVNNKTAVSNEYRWRVSSVAAAVNAMQSSFGGPIDEAAMAQYFGCNRPEPDEDDADDTVKTEAKKIKKEMDDRRKAWRRALLSKAFLWSDAALFSRVKTSSIATSEETGLSEEDKRAFNTAVKDLKKWVSVPDDLSTEKEKCQLALVLARHLLVCQDKPIGALASLRKSRKELPAESSSYKDLLDEMVKIMSEELEGMQYWVERIEEDVAERFPKVKQLIL